MKSHPTFTILGGQGALAAMEMGARLVRAWAAQHVCTQDRDYPQMTVHSVPWNGISPAGVLNPDTNHPYWWESALDKEPHTSIAMVACNTLTGVIPGHYRDHRIVHPWNSAVSLWSHEPLQVLAGERVLHLSMPQAWTPRVDLFASISELIALALRGQLTAARNCAVQLRAQLHEPTLLACTELSCVWPLDTTTTPTYDSMDAAITTALELSRSAS